MNVSCRGIFPRQDFFVSFFYSVDYCLFFWYDITRLSFQIKRKRKNWIMSSSVNISKQGGWVFYYSSDIQLSSSKCGKWMYFFNDKAFVEQICSKAVNDNIVSECKHTDDKEGVACFYINVDDFDAHRRVITFFIENRLIKKTKTGRYYNISFKLDSETRRGEYSAFGTFTTEIKLERFINLQTGQWIMERESLNSIIPFEIKLLSVADGIPLDKSIFGVDNACDYIKRAFPSFVNPQYRITGSTVCFFHGRIPDEVLKNGLFYIVRFCAIFYLKQGCEPFIKCKTSLMYPINKPIETSDIYSHTDGKYYDRYIDFDGKVKKCFPEFSLTKDDFELFNNRYNVVKIKVIDGCFFK